MNHVKTFTKEDKELLVKYFLTMIVKPLQLYENLQLKIILIVFDLFFNLKKNNDIKTLCSKVIKKF